MLSAMLRTKPFRQRFGLRVLAPMLLGLALTFRVSAVPVARAQAAPPTPNAAPATQTAPAPPAPAAATSVAPALPAPGPPSTPPPQAASPQPGDELPSLAPSPLLGSAPAAAPSETDPRALTDFRPHLDPYGYWVEHPNYGLVWVPRRDVVGDGFAPYVTSGRWALDETGEWVWVSDYPFGSVVFHYGRWAYVSDSGWVWVPGYRYAPAWVTWRVPTGSYAYVGWAPLPPDYGWFGGVSFSVWYGYSTPWVFCPSAYAFHRHVDHYIVRDRVLVSRLAAHSTRYVAAQPRRRANPATLRGPSAALRGPSPAAARIPAGALPRERVRAMPERRFDARPAPRANRLDQGATQPGYFPAPNRLRPERAAPRPGPDRAGQSLAPGRTERRVTPERTERRVTPERTERRVERPRTAPRVDPERIKRQFDVSRERVNPRPAPAPVRPSAPRPRRSK